MLLDVKNLAVSYGKNPKPTIADVSFDLNDGEILAIVGESGSGKTTVIRAILNVLPGGGRVSNGSMIFDGKNLLEPDAAGWRNLRGKNISMIYVRIIFRLSFIYSYIFPKYLFYGLRKEILSMMSLHHNPQCIISSSAAGKYNKSMINHTFTFLIQMDLLYFHYH